MSGATAGVAGPLKDPLSAALERARASYFEDYHSKHLDCARTHPPPETACPSCGYDMSVTAVSPTFLRDGWDDVTYTCARCGTQILRTVKSS
jgi:rRNA maturation endonuclease Nob1